MTCKDGWRFILKHQQFIGILSMPCSFVCSCPFCSSLWQVIKFHFPATDTHCNLLTLVFSRYAKALFLSVDFHKRRIKPWCVLLWNVVMWLDNAERKRYPAHGFLFCFCFLNSSRTKAQLSLLAFYASFRQWSQCKLSVCLGHFQSSTKSMLGKMLEVQIWFYSDWYVHPWLFISDRNGVNKKLCILYLGNIVAYNESLYKTETTVLAKRKQFTKYSKLSEVNWHQFQFLFRFQLLHGDWWH